MPLLKPEITKIMREAGLDSASKSSNGAKRDIKELLEDNCLGLEDTLKEMRHLRDMSDNESTKLRINEAILKMHGVMKDEGATVPSINIMIVDSETRENPILLPREITTKNKVN